ncbi:hypothetical protein Rumeso_00933 [Rubellimicrobium mesophilum DSM 19309]|uniref:DUF2946 domain-containing protein n=1 Tax=Rubellimicrobium mesophilum DSM 19309 TaxID=442562 RepID=A0A017HTN9_9RHOB|nr:hypothetical protein [Rubellimicrobium mesophilum]EYD77508.1 hypothetical protein Rumeso_00933 [Rubellimicrobium mesophilum DSM 19309]
MSLVRRLIDVALVLLLAVALAASGSMSMSMALADEAMADGAPTTCAKPMEQVGHAMPMGATSATCGTSHRPMDHHQQMPAHCSICLIAGAFAEMPGLGLPPLIVVRHPLPWIAAAAATPPEIHARTPPARGPPVLAL